MEANNARCERDAIGLVGLLAPLDGSVDTPRTARVFLVVGRCGSRVGLRRLLLGDTTSVSKMLPEEEK
jgi:hypothetical protein